MARPHQRLLQVLVAGILFCVCQKTMLQVEGDAFVSFRKGKTSAKSKNTL